MWLHLSVSYCIVTFHHSRDNRHHSQRSLCQVDIWNAFGRKELMRALEDVEVRRKLGDDVAEDYSAYEMGEKAWWYLHLSLPSLCVQLLASGF